MKVLIVMTGFFPGQKFGGPPVSVNNFCSLIKDFECYIVTRNHDLGDNDTPYSNINDGWNDRGNCKVKYLSDSQYGYKEFNKVVEEIKPEVLYLQGLFQDCVLPCLAIAKKHKLPVLLAPRGELCKGAFKKKYKKVPYIIFARMTGLLNCVSYQSTSKDETEAIKNHLGVETKNIFSLPNIPSIPYVEFKHSEKKTGIASIVYLSRIVPKKNLIIALETLKYVNGDVQFDIYGAKEDTFYWEKCKSVISSLPSNIRVDYKGNINHDMVQATFSKYDALLLPTMSENYGHAIVEAFSVGCPPIISDQTPWTDLQSYNAGWAIRLDRKKEFVKAVQVVVDNNEEMQMHLREGAQNYFTVKMKIDDIKKQYKEAFERSMQI